MSDDDRERGTLSYDALRALLKATQIDERDWRETIPWKEIGACIDQVNNFIILVERSGWNIAYHISFPVGKAPRDVIAFAVPLIAPEDLDEYRLRWMTLTEGFDLVQIPDSPQTAPGAQHAWFRRKDETP